MLITSSYAAALTTQASEKSSQRARESVRVPSVISAPRSCISNLNRLLKAAEGADLMDNPIPSAVQDTVSLLGAGFAAFNIGSELRDGDWVGALEDTANGSVSLVGGVKLLTAAPLAQNGLSLAGAALNVGFAARDVGKRHFFDAGVKLATATGLSLTSLGAGVADVVGMAVLGVSGLADLAYDQFRSDEEPHSL